MNNQRGDESHRDNGKGAVGGTGAQSALGGIPILAACLVFAGCMWLVFSIRDMALEPGAW